MNVDGNTIGKTNLARLPIGFKAASCSMRLGKRRIYRCNIAFSQVACEGVESGAKDSAFAPPHETFTNCIMISIPCRNVPPITTMLNHPDYATDNYDLRNFLVAARGWQMFCKFVKNSFAYQGYFHSCLPHREVEGL